MNYIEALEWRYATKKFDNTLRVDSAIINRILKAGNLAPNSLGLQLLTLIQVENHEIREQLRKVSYNQSQVTDASHYFIICAQKNITPEIIDHQMQRIANVREIERTSLDGFYNSIVQYISQFSSDSERMHWASKQAYIVLGNLLTACAIEHIDSCPMEGFEPQKYSEILQLESKNLFPIVALAIGYRAIDDKHQHLKKVRKTLDEFIITL